jgi:hypothetical protein
VADVAESRELVMREPRAERREVAGELAVGRDEGRS